MIVALIVAAGLAAQQPYVSELPGMGRPIDVAVTAARRQRLMQRLGEAVAVIPAAHERSVEAEGDHPQDSDFRQDNTFFYFSELESQDAFIVLTATQQILLLPPRNAEQERWTGVRLGPDSLAARLTGFPLVLPTTSKDSLLAALGAAGHQLPNLRAIVDSMRAVKDEAEIAALRNAARISAEAHADLMREARPGMFEYELEAIIEAGFRRRGADRLGYPSIVGSGFNATTLHYDVNRKQTRDGELVVVDAAAEWGQYTADVTRTFPINGRFTPRQRAIYELVLGAQQAAMDSTRPGQTMFQLDRIARSYIRDHSGELCAPGTCDRYFIHGLSHPIGMDVHDVGFRNDLVPGVVFTIEPGIYIPAESLGVRIEDDILVTATGWENLSAAAPRAVADIERLMTSTTRRSSR